MSWLRIPARTLGLPVVAAIVAVAIAGDLAVFAGPASVAGLVAVAGAAAVLHRTGVGRTQRGVALLAGACAVAVWFPFRASDALTAINSLTAIGLLAAAALMHGVDRLRPAMTVIWAMLDRVAAVLIGPFAIFNALAKPVRARAGGTSFAPLIRGVVFAAVPVAFLAALLASADVVFASLFSIEASPISDNLVAHSIVFGVLASALAGLLCVAESRRIEDGPTVKPLGGVESIVVLAAVALLFAVFAVTQFVVALGGADHVLMTQGLTRATYAREGFFQLLAVAGFTLLLVVGVQTFGRLDSAGVRLAYRVAATSVSMLTLIIVAVSVIRLNLYSDAFGLTMLRLLSTGFALLIGVIFVLFAVVTVLGGRRQWFWAGSVGAAVAALVMLNAINPEAFIARWNVDHAAAQVGGLDLDYLQGLSADAAAVLAEVAPAEIAARCAAGEFETTYGLAGHNRSMHAAQRLCADQ